MSEPRAVQVVSLRRHVLGRWQAMLRAEALLLHEAPGSLLQQVANQGQLAAAAGEARGRLSRSGRPWLRWIERPQDREADGSITLAALAGKVTVHALLADGSVLAEAVRWQRVGGGGSMEVATLGAWDPESGATVRSFYADAPQRLALYAVAGDRFLTRSTVRSPAMELDREVTLWDAASGSMVATFGGCAPWAFSADGRLLVVATEEGELALRETASGDEAARWAGPFIERSDGSRVLAVDLEREACLVSPDGRLLILACSDGSVRLLDLPTLHERAAFARARVDGFSPDGRWLLIRRHDEARLLDAATLAETARWQKVSRGTFSPDGRLLALDRDSTPPESHLYDLSSSGIVATLRGEVVAFAPDGRHLVHGPLASVWDVASRAPVAYLDDGEALFSPRRAGVVHSPDGGRLAVFGPSLLRVWDLSSGRQLVAGTGRGGPEGRVAFVPDGNALLSGGEDGTLRLWPLREGVPPAADAAADVDHGPVSAVAFTAEDELVRAFEKQRVCGLSTDGEARARTVAARSSAFVVSTRAGGDVCGCRAQGEVRFCLFSPDRTRVLSVTASGEVALWRTDEGPEPRPVRLLEGGAFPGPLCAAFAADGMVLALAYLAGGIELWSVPLQRCLKGRGLRGGGREPRSCAFSADDRHFAVAHREGVTVWEVRSGAVVAELRSPGGASAVAFTRARLLAVGSAAGRLWVHRQEDWSVVCETRMNGGISSLAWSADGELLAAVAGGAVHVLAPTGL